MSALEHINFFWVELDNLNYRKFTTERIKELLMKHPTG
jgi:hypothetical protein